MNSNGHAVISATIYAAHISLLHVLLKEKQIPDYDGGLQTALLQTALLQQRSRALSKSSNAMLVIRVHERRHWAVIPTKGCDNSTIKYYDSFYRDFLSKRLLAS